MIEGCKVGGVLLLVDGALRFVPASVAVRVAAPPRVTAVPGTPPPFVGIALHEGLVVPVISVGSARAEMIVCQHAGELVGIVGGSVVRTGSFGLAGDASDRVEHEGRAIEALDVAAVYAQMQSHRLGVWRS
jgi:hypothetical protein